MASSEQIIWWARDRSFVLKTIGAAQLAFIHLYSLTLQTVRAAPWHGPCHPQATPGWCLRKFWALRLCQGNHSENVMVRHTRPRAVCGVTQLPLQTPLLTGGGPSCPRLAQRSNLELSPFEAVCPPPSWPWHLLGGLSTCRTMTWQDRVPCPVQGCLYSPIFSSPHSSPMIPEENPREVYQAAWTAFFPLLSQARCLKLRCNFA